VRCSSPSFRPTSQAHPIHRPIRTGWTRSYSVPLAYWFGHCIGKEYLYIGTVGNLIVNPETRATAVAARKGNLTFQCDADKGALTRGTKLNRTGRYRLN
jgi:hypothetical protein